MMASVFDYLLTNLEGSTVKERSGQSGEACVVDAGLVTIAEASKFLGLCRASLYVLMERGELAYCKIGGARRIPRKSLIDLAEKCLVVG
jgi:excisionase family DNA binding protein